MVVWILSIASAGAHFFNVGFIPMLAEVTPEDRRATVFSARNIVYNASLSVCTLLFGLLLNGMEFPTNYQIMYVIGFAASCLSTYFPHQDRCSGCHFDDQNTGFQPGHPSPGEDFA